MNRQKHQKGMIDLANYKMKSTRPRRAGVSTTVYSARNQVRHQTYVQLLNKRSKPSKRKSALHLIVAIIGAIIFLPLFVITPLIIAITLNNYFPIS